MNQIFDYNGNSITFQSGNGDVMVNASEMAKPFGKTTKDYLRSQFAKEFIEALSVRRKCLTIDLVNVQHGNGTWMHEDVALDFAQWLSVDFKLWCNDRIKELLKHGATAINPEDLMNPDFIITLATQLKTERAEKVRLQHQNEFQAKELKQSAPKVEFYNTVMTSTSTYTATLIAKELGMSAVTLNKRLHEMGVQYKQRDTWMLYAKYQDQRYHKNTTVTFTGSSGETKTTTQMEWTEKGREFIHQLLNPELNN